MYYHDVIKKMTSLSFGTTGVGVVHGITFVELSSVAAAAIATII